MKTAKQTHSASAFTPGPWRVIPDSLDILADPSPGLRGRFIATALESTLANDGTDAVFVERDLEAVANARLIASAPDLLALVQRALAFWNEPARAFGADPKRKADLLALQTDMRATLATATFTQPSP